MQIHAGHERDFTKVTGDNSRRLQLRIPQACESGNPRRGLNASSRKSKGTNKFTQILSANSRSLCKWDSTQGISRFHVAEKSVKVSNRRSYNPHARTRVRRMLRPLNGSESAAYHAGTQESRLCPRENQYRLKNPTPVDLRSDPLKPFSRRFV